MTAFFPLTVAASSCSVFRADGAHFDKELCGDVPGEKSVCAVIDHVYGRGRREDGDDRVEDEAS